jgi:DNA-binding NarL/FixJ family response regulator
LWLASGEEGSTMMSTAYAPDRITDAEHDQMSATEPMQIAELRTDRRAFRTRVLIASPQPIVRHGLRALFADAADIDLIAETESGSDAVRLARQLRPDVVAIDLLMPDVDGITATRTIRAEIPNTHVVVMAGIDEDGPAFEAMRAGASAYLTKETRTDTLLRTIRGAGSGQVALSSQAAARLVRMVGRHDVISERESEVMRLVARGKANKQIARELNIAQSTVKSHIGSLLSKLGLLSRTQLALYAARTGLVSLQLLDAEPTMLPATGTG